VGEFDLSKAHLKDKPVFQPFRVPGQGEALQKARLKPQEELLLIEKRGSVKSFLIKQMAYHHIAQGEAGGEPYLISF